MFAFVRTQKLKERKKIDNVHAHNARTYIPPNANPIPPSVRMSVAPSDILFL